MNLWIYGINPVQEALRSERCRIKEIWVAKGRNDKGLEGIISKAQAEEIPIKKVERKQLDSLTRNAPHQGVVCLIDQFNYANLDEVLQGREDTPLLLILDGIEDPRNLGALIRTANACGVWGVIIPKDRAAGLTPAVVKSSAGAVFHIPIVRVTNVAATLKEIKAHGIWVTGAVANAQKDLYHHDLTAPLAVVIGGEGRGIRPLVRRECDLLIAIPMKGVVNSLNASAAGSIILYEVIRQRRKATDPL
jgi:23S rRNA (guanosine2251-2'-O)-methyltransferase